MSICYLCIFMLVVLSRFYQLLIRVDLLKHKKMLNSKLIDDETKGSKI